jgi:mono/diheme cytochrome c family protein
MKPIPLIVLSLLSLMASSWYLFWRQSAPPPAFVQTTTVADRTLTLEVSQLVAGERTITATLRDKQGQPVVIDGVDLAFTMPFVCSDEIKLSLPAISEGTYQARGTFFGMTGGWVTDITLRDALARTERARMVVTIDTLDIATPFTLEQLRDPATIAAGQQLYAANCLGCHGSSGRGDGPSGVMLSPTPPDFATHMVAGKHTDGQVFLMISNGSVGTAMQAYRERLSDEQIWQLVAFLRTFAQ